MRTDSIRQAMRAADQPPLPPLNRQLPPELPPPSQPQPEEMDEGSHVRAALGLPAAASLGDVLSIIGVISRRAGSNRQTARALMSALAHQLED